MLRRPPVLALVLALAASGAHAASTVPLAPAEKESLAAFAARNAGCLEWTDDCVVCKRQDEGGFACSTPGIACTASRLACRTPAASDDAGPKADKP